MACPAEWCGKWRSGQREWEARSDGNSTDSKRSFHTANSAWDFELMSHSLKAKTVGALSWSLVQELSQRGLQFAIGIVLARLLSPKEFGLLAMLTIFIAVSQALVDSGFGSALIQRKNPSEQDECSVFYFNMFLGACLAGMLCLVAPWIARFYNQPQLTALMRTLSVVLVINSVSVVQNALMVRRLDFKSQALVSATSLTISGTIGLTMAWRGFGVWSLVVQQIANSLVRGVVLWTINSWRPKRQFSFQSLRSLFKFGSGMLGSVLLNNIFENLYSLVIGKVFSAVTLGYYTRAATLQNMASQCPAMVVNRVTFPVFSKLQDEPARLKRGFQKAITTTAFVQFPALVGLAAVAKPLVLVLLTEKWAPAIPYLRLLCFVGLLYPMHLLNLNVLVANGRSDLMLRIELIKRVLVITNIAVTYRWGVLAMVWGQVVNSVLAFFLNSFYTRRFIGYSVPNQIRDISPYLAAAAAMGTVVILIELPQTFGNLAQLGVKCLAGGITYFLICRGFRLPAFSEVVSLFRRARPAVA